MIKLSDQMKTNDLLAVPYRGTVVATDVDAVDSAGQPKRLGRIKCRVPGLLESTTIADLPWIYAKQPVGLGGRSDSSSFHMPEINSEVIVEFPYRDIYAGFYTGYWQNENSHQGFLDENYPNSYGFRDTQNTFLKINKAQKFLEFQHASGARVFIDTDSTFELTSAKAFIFQSADNKTQFKFDMESGNLSLMPKGDLEIGGHTTKFSAHSHDVQIGTLDEKIGGYHKEQVAGGKKTIVGGSKSTSVLGDVGDSVGGDSSTLIAGKVERIIGQGVKETIATSGEDRTIILGDSKLQLVLGDMLRNLVLGKVDIETLAGSLTLANLIGKMDISLTGGLEFSNLIGKLTVSPVGAIDLKNAVGKVTVSPIGAIEVSNPLGKITIGVAGDIEVSNPLGSLKIDPTGSIKMDATLQMALKSMLIAEFSGLVQTKVGSPAGITEIDGTLITLGGPAGLPVARLGDICMGVGNLGIPVVSTIMLGSFKVLAL